MSVARHRCRRWACAHPHARRRTGSREHAAARRATGRPSHGGASGSARLRPICLYRSSSAYLGPVLRRPRLPAGPSRVADCGMRRCRSRLDHHPSRRRGTPAASARGCVDRGRRHRGRCGERGGNPVPGCFADRVATHGIEAGWAPILAGFPPVVGAMVRDAIPRSDPASIVAAAAIGRERSIRDVTELVAIPAATTAIRTSCPASGKSSGIWVARCARVGFVVGCRTWTSNRRIGGRAPLGASRMCRICRVRRSPSTPSGRRMRASTVRACSSP